MPIFSSSPNKKYYETTSVAEHYGCDTNLFKAEEAIFSSLKDAIKDKPILDVGVGAGRTTPYLRAISEDYIGIDYSQKMIDAARQKHAGATFQVCDARDMSAFEDERFAAVFYCFNGIDEVSPSDRILILKEINRVLKREGVFSFSSHNLDWQSILTYSFSGFSFSPDPIAFIKDSAIRLKVYAAGALSQARNKIHSKGWAVIPEYEKLSGGSLPTYYISKKSQIGQLSDVGFCASEALDSDGLPIHSEKWVRDPFLYYVARKR